MSDGNDLNGVNERIIRAVQLMRRFTEDKDAEIVQKHVDDIVALAGYIGHVAVNADEAAAAAYVAYRAGCALFLLGYEAGSETANLDKDVWGGAFGGLDY